MRTPGLILAKAARPSRCLRLRVQGRVEGDEVASRQELVEGQELHVHGLGHRRGDEGVVTRDLHPEGTAARGHLAPDPPETDDAQALAAELDPRERLPVPLPRLHGGVGLGDVAGDREQQGEGQLGGGHEVAHRRVHDDHAAARGRVEVHVVDAHARPADDLQVLRRVQHLGRDLAAAADQDRVVGRDDLGQLRGRQGFLTSTVKPSALSRASPRSVMPSRQRTL